MEVQCDVDINNTKTQPAQIHFHPDIHLLWIIILSCRSDFFSWFLFWKQWKFHPKFIFLKESYHIYEEKSEIYLVWLKCWIKINIGNNIKNPTIYLYTCRFFSLSQCWKCRWTPIKLNAILYIIAEILLTVTLIPIKLATILYVIPDTLLKVSLNTNKTGLHVIPDTLLKVSLNTNKTGHHVLRYN
jgi:hypothetical protein